MSAHDFLSRTATLMMSITAPTINRSILTVAFVLVTSYFLRVMRKKNNFTTVPGLPFIGNLILAIPPNKFFNKIDDCIKKYGSILELWIVNRRIVVVADKTIAKEVLMDRPKTFCRFRSQLTPAKVLGLNGLLFAEGDSWSRQRRLTAPPFSHKNIELMSPLIAKEIDEFILRLRGLADGTTVLEMDEQVYSYSIKVISSVAFGNMPKEYYDYCSSTLLICDIKAIFQYLLERTMFPFPAFLWRYTPQSKSENEAIIADSRLSQLCMGMIIEKKKAIAINAAPDSTYRTSLLDNLIGTKLGGESPLTDDELISNVKTFFLGGSDTVTVPLTWCIYYLCIDKELQKALQIEIDGVLSFNGTGAEALSALADLPLCSACFKEALRLRPPVEYLIFEPVEKTVTLSNGMLVRPGEEVFVSLAFLMLDSEVFPEPNDFKASRWLTTSEKLVEMNASFTAFGYGSRACPGQALALSEGISVLATLIRNFDMELACPKGEIEKVNDSITRANKMPVRLSTRGQ